MASIWSIDCHIPERENLPGDTAVDAAVIGAGIAGILTASALQKKGRKVIVLEADRIASGQTCSTTAKITSQHGLIYSKLLKTQGISKAGQYAAANEHAVEEYKKIITSQHIDCDFEETDAFVFGYNEKALINEVSSAAQLGLPAEFVKDLPLPFQTAGAVKFSQQAQFNPLKFIKSISKELTVYEHTPVIKAEENILTTPYGKVEAKDIVFATHYPFINFPGLYFARMHQERSYVIAVNGAPQLNGMYIGAKSNGYSFRNYGDLLLIGGGNHRTGENSEGGRYEHLLQKAQEWFPGCSEVARWSAQDCMTPDSIPYIGKYSVSHPNWYVATGFQKWGMSTSMAAAIIITDMICGKENANANIFDPGRFNAETIPGIVQEGKEAIKGLVRKVFQIPEEVSGQIKPGHGGIVYLDGEKIGVYRDDNGEIHPVDIRCPHLGCQLEWNPDELSWDCPCHGSRFTYQGELISGPAQKNLEQI